MVLTSIADDTHSAGFQPNGEPQNDTNNDGDFRANALARRPLPGDWDIAIGVSYDYKEVYDSFGIGVSFGKRFGTPR